MLDATYAMDFLFCRLGIIFVRVIVTTTDLIEFIEKEMEIESA